MKTFTESQRVLDSVGNIKVTARCIQCNRLKANETLFFILHFSISGFFIIILLLILCLNLGKLLRNHKEF